MRKMKDSGIEWIGEIPEGYSLSRLKYYIKFINGYAFDSNEFSTDNGIPVIRIGDIVTKIDVNQCVKVVPNIKYNSVLVEKHDILLAMSGATFGKNALLYNKIQAYINQRVGIIRSNANNYFYYLFNIDGFFEYLKYTFMGSAQPNISGDDIKNYIFLNLPNKNQIADFLDKKCSQIDELIANNQSQIDKLKEYKQSVITQAVTKGLDPNVETKDSGIDWIGQIPKNWSTNIGKRVLLLKKRLVREDDEVITCFRDGVVTLRKNRREEGFTFSEKEIGYQGIDVGDIVIHGMDGFAGAIGISDSKGKGSPVLSVCTSKLNMSSKYIVYYLRTLAINNVFIALSTGIRERSCDLRWSKIAILEFIIPEIKEQNEIVNYIDQKCSQIDSLIEIKQQKIEKLQEYKKSLIYEYVTGKKEIC